MKCYLDFFNFTIDEMIAFCDYNIESFSNEFSLTQDFRKSFNKVFSEIRGNMLLLEYDFLLDDKIDFKKEINERFKKKQLSI
jgi:hypothetical protein